MKIGILDEEWFPVFCVSKAAVNWDHVSEKQILEIDDITLKRWEKTFTEFIALQNELAGLIGEHFYEDNGFDMENDDEVAVD